MSAKYPPWIIVDAVERYLDGLYDLCVQKHAIAPPFVEEQVTVALPKASSPLIASAKAEKTSYEGPEAMDAKHDGILCPRDMKEQIINAVNVARRKPRHFVPFVAARSPGEGKSLAESTAEFLRKVAPLPRELRENPMLSATCDEAIRLLGPDRARHTASFLSFMQTRGSCAEVVGEMYWASSEMPRSGFDVVADFLVDDGNPDRSHRLGIFDNEFREVGVQISQTPFGEFVVFLHFADCFRLYDSNLGDTRVTAAAHGGPGLLQSQTLNTPSVGAVTEKTSTRKHEPIVGMTKETRKEDALEGFIDLTSSPETGNSPERPRTQQEARPE